MGDPVCDTREAAMGARSEAGRVVRSYPFGPVDRLEIDPMYFWLQEHEPLSRVRLPYGDEGWLLTRYDDVRTASSDPRFSLAEAAVRDVPRLNPMRAGAILTDLDPPEHTRLHRLVAKASPWLLWRQRCPATDTPGVLPPWTPTARLGTQCRAGDVATLVATGGG